MEYSIGRSKFFLLPIAINFSKARFYLGFFVAATSIYITIILALVTEIYIDF